MAPRQMEEIRRDHLEERAVEELVIEGRLRHGERPLGFPDSPGLNCVCFGGLP
jgi:hypothetical protein